jgi:hypothetical protein
MPQVKITNIYHGLAILVLRAGLVFILIGAGWLIYKRLPEGASELNLPNAATTLQIVLDQAPDNSASSLEIAVELYPVDIVAVRHEFFTEPRAGKRFEDFLKERMKGRSPITGRLDRQGRGTVVLTPGNWWLHAKLTGDEDLEWRLPVSITGGKQTVELTAQNAYTRTKSF